MTNMNQLWNRIFLPSFLCLSMFLAPAHQEYLWDPLLNISGEALEKMILPNYIDWYGDLIHNDNITLACRNDIQQALDSLRLKKTWALKLFNSWGKPVPSGLMIGTMTDYGDYDQCLSIDDVRPQYCLLDYSFPVEPLPQPHNLNRAFQLMSNLEGANITEQWAELVSKGTMFRDLVDFSTLFHYVYIRFGICLPDTCCRTDIQTILDEQFEQIGLNLKQINCEPKMLETWTPNFLQTFAIICIVSLLTITLFSALYDRMAVKKNELPSETVLLWFSPVRNIRKLICTKSQDELTCVHGIRFLTLVWIIIGHTIEWNPFNIFRETFKIKYRLSSLEYQPLFKAHYSVDTFFYLRQVPEVMMMLLIHLVLSPSISGLLTSYVTFKYTQGDFKKFRYVPYLFLRYLRLTPQLVAFLLLLSILPPLFDGPLWSSYTNLVTEKCSKTWWLNLLYMQNLINVENICGLHTWYLAADMQLHWMSVVFVTFLLKYQRKGLVLTKCFILVCVFATSVTIFLKQFPPGSVITTRNDFLVQDDKPSDFLIFFYGPQNHTTVFFIGFIFGARLHNTNWKQYTLKKSTKYLYWFVALLGYIFCIYSTVPWLLGRPYDPFWSAILFPLNSFVWSCVLTLIIWLCITNNGSIMGRFLSWSGFRPLSRMTYSVYLTHVLIIYVLMGTRRDLVDIRLISIAQMLSGLLVMCYLFGFVFTVIFEAPLFHLLEHLKNNLFAINSDSGAIQNLKEIDEKKTMFNVESDV